ncbi:hypothetical protein N9123_02160, partial [Pseudomonadales bacterium]|nr:hypothetical protein [Pseudomonadales bacterium]
QEDRLRGALLGGTLGALTGGLGAAAAPAAGGSAATSALSSATSGLGGAASAKAAADASIVAASGLSVPTQALGVAAPAATTSLVAPSSGLSTALGAAPSTVAAPLTGLDKFKAVVKDKPLETALFSQSLLGGGQQQPRQAPVYAAPIQQGGGIPAPPSIEERLAMTGGNAPSFIPRGLFEEERAVLDDEDKLRQLQKLTLQGGF